MRVKRLWILEGVLVLAGAAAVVAAVAAGSGHEQQPAAAGGVGNQASAESRKPTPSEAGRSAEAASGREVFVSDSDGDATGRGTPTQVSPASVPGSERKGAGRVTAGPQPVEAASATSDQEPEVPLSQREPAEIATELLARIADATDGKLDDQELQALKVLQDSGIDAVELLRKEYFSPPGGKAVDVVRNSIIIQALQYLATPSAREALLEIACAEQPNARTLGPRAVRALAGMETDSDELSLALEAPHPATRDAAARALAHRSLSPRAIDALAAEMSSASWVTQNLVATAFATDSSRTGSSRKVEAILDNYVKLGDRVDDSAAVPEGVFWTPTEMARSAYISSLTRMPKGEDELRRRLKSASGAPREALLLALGRGGAESARSELLKMARQAEEGFVRTMAVNALYGIATDEDRPLLQHLAENDPFERSYVVGRDGKQATYPVRYAARQVLDRLEQDAAGDTAR